MNCAVFIPREHTDRVIDHAKAASEASFASEATKEVGWASALGRVFEVAGSDFYVVADAVGTGFEVEASPFRFQCLGDLVWKARFEFAVEINIDQSWGVLGSCR